MSKITFLVFTYNEEQRVEYMLRCLSGHGELVVIDNFSSDNTVEICSRYTNEIYKFKNIGYVENYETMSFALSKVQTEWAYLALVDELIPSKLMELLHKVSNNPDLSVVEIYRRNFFYGREVFNYGKHHLRMFRPGVIDFKDNIVHSLGRKTVGASKIYKVPAKSDLSIYHFADYCTSSLERSHSRYADLEAYQLHTIKHRKFSGIKALWTLIFYFWGTYLGLGGFRGGWPGLFISVQIAYYKFSIHARLWEYDHEVNPESIRATSNKIKESIIAGKL